MAESTALQETQSIGIHDILFEKGTTSFLILNVLEAKIFQYNSLEGHNV